MVSHCDAQIYSDASYDF